MMQQCQKCKTWVESKDLTTGGCVNCNSATVISNGEVPDTGDELWAEWDSRMKEAAEVIQLVCKTRHNGSKRCTECPLSKDKACIANNPGEIPKDWVLPGQVKHTSFEPGNPKMSYVAIPVNGDRMWKDELGEYHGEGIGYNLQGVFCGKCTRETCEGCVHKDVEK